MQSVDRNKRAKARPFLLPKQHLVEQVEPAERNARLAVLRLLFLIQERLAAPDFVYDVLNVFRAGARLQLRERIAQVDQGRAFRAVRLAESLFRQDEIAEIMNGVLDHLIELWMGLRGDAGTVAADETPQRFSVLGIRRRHQREQHRKRDRQIDLRRLAGM